MAFVGAYFDYTKSVMSSEFRESFHTQIKLFRNLVKSYLNGMIDV